MLSREGILITQSWRESAMKALSLETTRPVELYAHNLLHTALQNRTPLNEKEYATHLNYAYVKTESLENRGINTENLNSTVTANGRVWTPERETLHKEIINDFLTDWDMVPLNREAVLSGGLAGGGKTTTLTQHTHFNLNDYAFLSPDDVKEKMSEKDMFPSIRGLTTMEASALGYEESCYITNLLFQDCLKAGRNLIYDTTMGSRLAVEAKLEPMREHGYTMSAVFIDIQISTSLRRSQERHRAGLTKFLTTGNGYGGRLLPRHAVKRQIPDHPTISSSKNREIFNHYRETGWFNESYLFDNNVEGRAPQLIG
jgi:predicted kinase